MPSQEILKLHYGTPFEVEEILTYINKPVARILVFKIRPSQQILKIRDGTPSEWPSQEILKIRDEPPQEILKIRDGTLFEADEILTYIKSPRNGLVCYFSSKLDVPSNVLPPSARMGYVFFGHTV
ncbi:hypothetical protein OROMI_007680 [Orobanche minor]